MAGADLATGKKAGHSCSRLQRVPWLVLILTVLVTLLALYQALQAKDSLFRAWVTELSFKKQVEFKRFSEPIVTSLGIAREWGKNQELDFGDSARIDLYFMPTLKSLPQIHALILADTEGQEYYLRRQGDEWYSRRRDPRRWPGKVLERTWRDGAKPGPGKLVSSDYDPRQRPWFKGCIAMANPDEVFWTPPYRFFSNGRIGVTVARKWSAAKGSALRQYVVAFDVLISDLLAWTRELDLGPAGRAFMISDEDRVLGLPPEEGGTENGLPSVAKLVAMGFGEALKKWQRERVSGEQVFPFRVDRQTWWAGFVPLKFGDRHLWLAVLIPEKDILQIASYRVSFFWIPLGIFIAGSFLFLLSFFLVRRHVASLEDLHRENRRLVNEELAREASPDDPAARIRELIRAGESERLEFKATVRWNLRENRAGKEIEIAWLKGVVGFLNTEGGVLLIGVEDDGTIAGIERDNFTNDDKCLRHIDSLISTHIGLEFSRYVHFTIIEVEGRKVVEIRCHRSENPAFLRKGDAEEFYIRTGPASRKLKPSQIIKYLASRKTDIQSQ